MPRADSEDWKLVEEARSGTRAGFERLMDRFERRVYNLSLRMLDEPGEAEDAAQEVFIQIHRSLPRFRGESRLDTWIHRITVNVCLQRRRRTEPRTRPIEEAELCLAAGDDPSRSVEQAELRDRVRDALHVLPEGQREVVILHGIQGLTYVEVAEVLAIPVGTVKSRLSTAFGRLRGVLAGYVHDGGEAGPRRQVPEAIG